MDKRKDVQIIQRLWLANILIVLGTGRTESSAPTSLTCAECPFACRELVAEMANPAVLRYLLGAEQHRNSGEQVRVPDYLIIGTQKGGTSDLWARLVTLPHFKRGQLLPKEMHFFDGCLGVLFPKDSRGSELSTSPASQWCDFNREYAQVFANVSASTLIHVEARSSRVLLGDASPSYLLFTVLPRLVNSVMPKVRAVVLLRNPTERAFSGYFQAGRSLIFDGKLLSFEDAIASELQLIQKCERKVSNISKRWKQCIWPEFRDGMLRKTLKMSGPWDDTRERTAGRCTAGFLRKHSILLRGLYAFQLDGWLAHLGKQRLFVVRSEDYFTDPSTTTAQVANFIANGSHDFVRSDHRGFNGVPTTVKGKGQGWKTVGEMSDATRLTLEAMYRPYNQFLQEQLKLFGIQFDGWN